MKVLLSLFSLFALLNMRTIGIQEGDIDGALGSGHWFEWTNNRGVPRNGVDFLGTVTHVFASSGCCQGCGKMMPEMTATEMFDFSPYSARCYCLARDASGQRPVSHRVEYVAGVCDGGPERVDGGVGEGRLFLRYSVEYLGSALDVEDRGGCCRGCKEVDEESRMFEFGAFTQRGCYCFKPRQRITPVTRMAQFFSGLCG